jgi:hypothetical protein
MVRLLISLLTIFAVSAHPCDTEHASTCPSASGDQLGSCLTSLTAVSESCKKWLDFHNICSVELERECSKRCEGSPCSYTEDAIPCVAFWTHDDNKKLYSEGCRSVLPGPVKKEEQSEERKRRSEERKRKRREKQNEVPETPLNLPDPTEL